MMRTEDLKTIAALGEALWANPSQAEKVSVETVTAVSMLNLTEDRSFERATTILFKRALHDGTKANSSAIHQPFFRLAPEERFVLALLHTGKVSYARISKILDRTPEQVAILAWTARLHLANAPGNPGFVAHPTGSDHFGVHCPEYDFTQPWTQRFLDEEIPVRERLFLQNHMMVCKSCREALNRCRKLYYSVDALLPRIAGLDEKSSFLEIALKRSAVLTHSSSSMSTGDGMAIFLGRWDIRLVLLFSLLLIVWKVMSS